jgi:hypothetical protein
MKTLVSSIDMNVYGDTEWPPRIEEMPWNAGGLWLFPHAAVRKAGYTPSDVATITVRDMRGSSWQKIRDAEQAEIDRYGGIKGGTILNRRNEVP